MTTVADEAGMTRQADLSNVAEQVKEVRGRQLPRYPAYKPSGVQWLGDIPHDWRKKPLKFIARLNTEVLPEDTDPEYEIAYVDISNVDYVEGILGAESYRFEDAPSRARRRVRDGDVILSTVRTYLKAIARIEKAPENLIASTGFAVVRPGPEIVPGYLYRLLQSEEFIGRVVASSVGVSYPAVAASTVGRFDAWLPPLDEQQAIAAFLDRETAEIDALIAKKRRLIELLKEKRTALISHAVTKGLNPKAPMKPSGIDWLGDVPAHWRLLRLRFIATIQSGLTLGKKYDPGTTISCPYLRVANVQDGYLDLTEITQVEIPPGDAQRFELQAGDVLMTEGGDFDKLGRGYVWEGQIAGCLHQNHIFAVRPHAKHLDSHFLACVLTSSHGKNYFTSTSQQTTNLATTNRTKLGNLCVPLPDVEEQRAILAWIRARTHAIDNIVKTGEAAIVKLNEYRSALISAAVTGKIDVRAEVR